MKRWYVVQIYAGYEDAIRSDLERRIEKKGLKDLFGQILVPSAKAANLFDAVSSPRQKIGNQLFPGYLLIEVELTPETKRLIEVTPRIIKFLGGKDPVPLSQKEIDRIMSQIKGEVAVAPKKSDFQVGSEVEIVDGPFAGFMGVIEKVDEANERLSVMVSIFGRMTPVELGFNQVKY